jgi:hypothetical protein
MAGRFLAVLCVAAGILSPAPAALSAELLVGAATSDITPDGPVAVSGQFNLRIARKVETPVTATAIALESRDGQETLDTAVMVSCDVVVVPDDVRAMVREKVKAALPELDTSKIFLAATHTHTAPVLRLGKYEVPTEGVVQVEDYREFFAERVADAIARAWNGRRPGSVSWGLSDAVVGYNRRAAYADGHSQMYGATNVPDFRSLEGYEDHDVGTLFFWNDEDRLVAVAIDVACPSQEVESRSAVNADYWHPVRESLRRRYGEDLCVLGWCAPAGDQSPHLMVRKAADERMRQLRGLDRLDEIARRIVRAVDEAHEVVQEDRHAAVPLVHKVETLRLPMRLVTEAEYAEAKAECDKARAQIESDPKAADRLHMRMKWYQVTVERFESQKTEPNPVHEVELHVLRIGDVAVCTNPFELFTDYGIRIKARSPAVQTFPIQLVGSGTYLPTEKAVRGGHYSAVVHSSLVGPEGGQILVDRTVELINSLWEPAR